MLSCNTQYLRTASAFLKIGEVIAIVVTFGLFRGVPVTFGDPFHISDVGGVGTDLDFFAGGVMVTALIVTPLFFLCYLLGRIEMQKTVLEMLLNFILSASLFISGSLCLGFYNSSDLSHHWKDKKSDGMTMGIFCYISASFYLADTLVAIRNYCRKGNESQA